MTRETGADSVGGVALRAGDPQGGAPWRQDERGIVLPVVLLLVVALSAAATSLLLLARGERWMGEEAHRFLIDRVRSEADLAREIPPATNGGVEASSAAGRSERSLGGGFILRTVEGSVAGGAVRVGLRWRFDPDSVAAALPLALEIGGGDPDGTVALLGDDCPPVPGEAPLIRLRGTPAPEPSPPDPALPPPPRLGILGIEALSKMPSEEIPEGGELEGGEVATIYRAPLAGEITGGDGFGLLLAPGELTIGGSAAFRGLVLVGGDLLLRGEARIEGVALLGGRLIVEGGGAFLGCRGIAAAALRQPVLTRDHPIPGGWALGRF